MDRGHLRFLSQCTFRTRLDRPIHGAATRPGHAFMRVAESQHWLVQLWHPRFILSFKSKVSPRTPRLVLPLTSRW